MKFDLYLKRQKVTIAEIVRIIDARSYNDLNNHFKSIGIKCPSEDQLDYEFKKEDVEERTTVKSGGKKKRVSNKKNGKPKSNDSASPRGSGSSQRVRKSPVKRQGKSNSDKVEPIQSSSGSESSK
jgi:hypothetical protein